MADAEAFIVGWANGGNGLFQVVKEPDGDLGLNASATDMKPGYKLPVSFSVLVLFPFRSR